MSSFLIISPDPELSVLLQSALELNDHVVDRMVGGERWPEDKFDVCILDIPIWEKEEIEFAKKLANKAKRNGSKVSLILPRGRKKPPPRFNTEAVICRPYELLNLVRQLESLIK